MNKCDEALLIFNQGFNCSQAVVSVFCEELGLDKEAALKIRSQKKRHMKSLRNLVINLRILMVQLFVKSYLI